MAHPKKSKSPSVRALARFAAVSHARLLASGKAPMVSKIPNPVQRAWEVFSEAKATLADKLTRKHAMDLAMAAGVSYHTARTQYQEWKQAGDRDNATTRKLYGTQ